jgi:hypothetical protein
MKLKNVRQLSVEWLFCPLGDPDIAGNTVQLKGTTSVVVLFVDEYSTI